MCCLIMVIRAETLPTDPTALAGMVLARRRERAVAPVVQTLKDMIIGARSERFIAVADEQLALEFNDVCKMLGRPILPAHAGTRRSALTFAYARGGAHLHTDIRWTDFLRSSAPDHRVARCPEWI
jgi:hypothetical protein